MGAVCKRTNSLKKCGYKPHLRQPIFFTHSRTAFNKHPVCKIGVGHRFVRDCHFAPKRTGTASISADIFQEALDGLLAGRIPSADTKLLGRSMSEAELRKGLEDTYRVMARLAPDSESRVALIDRANSVRPWSLF